MKAIHPALFLKSDGAPSRYPKIKNIYNDVGGQFLYCYVGTHEHVISKTCLTGLVFWSFNLSKSCHTSHTNVFLSHGISCIPRILLAKLVRKCQTETLKSGSGLQQTKHGRKCCKIKRDRKGYPEGHIGNVPFL